MKLPVGVMEQLFAEAFTDSDKGRAIVIGDFAGEVVGNACQRQSQISWEALSFKQASAVLDDSTITRDTAGRPWTLAVVVQAGCGGIVTLQDKVGLKALLCRLRDVHSDRVLHLVISDNGSTSAWSLSDSLEMGFSVFSKNLTESQAITVYEFSLLNYKTCPDWLNARFWAHPHLWNRRK